MQSEETEHRTAQFIGVGCVTAVAGFFSGGMIGVFIAKVVGSFRGCQPPEGLPACDWHLYAGVGMLIGVLTLPALALNRLRRRAPATSERD
jgi:MFS family permease